MIRFVALIIILFGLLQANVSVAGQLTSEVDSSQPIEITSQQLEILQLEQKSVFTGNVVAKQGGMTLAAEQIIVFFLEEGNQIDRLEAIGNVHFTQLDREATADRAVYRQQEEVLFLVGSAQVKQGLNQINGDEITLYIKENKSLVKSSEQNRVKAVIVPEQKKDTQ
ncbi:MAG: lipopolysaccharide transport periplasmic protein LptA [Deltaproteobacteria bacterium]|jgi:lipopolysaccharide export system protein LptA|nr:lipopolysaccharide transport periplasmic protein LptA [Deltaproteobacteria bacterium]